MLLEFVGDQPFTIDGKAVAKNVRLNLLNVQQQFRLKATLLNGNKENKIDLVMYQYTLPKLDGLSAITITGNGKEIILNQSFDFELKYYFLKKEWKFSGHVGYNSFNYKFDHLVKIINIITKIFK